MKDSHILELQAELLSIYATIEGMKAQNVYRESTGKTIVYDESSFQAEANKVLRIRDMVIQLTEG